MKRTLLSTVLFITICAFGQAPINSFYGDNNSNFAVLASATTLDHSASGANQTWNFNSLLALGTSVRTYTTPTAAELSSFAGTTNVINNTSTVNSTTTTGKMLTKDVSNTISVTGIESSGLTINFSTNNATIGLFPMNYNYSNTDSNVSGTYNYDTYSGTFTGNLVTTVDAYGTLSLNDTGNGAYSGSVTRMKTVLSINLNYGFLTNVGTITQTTYSYYDGSITSNNPIFRSSTTVAVVALAGINQTDVSLERYIQNPLGIQPNQLSNISIANPVSNNLTIFSPETIQNATISITDISGKNIYNETQTLVDNVSIPFHFSSGIYLLKIYDGEKSMVKKIIKN